MLRSLRRRACCQNEPEVGAGRAESGPESAVLLSPESGAWLGRKRAALLDNWRKCPDFLLTACGHFSMAADNPTLGRASYLKEGPRVIFKLPLAEATEALDKWVGWARRCRIPAFV